MNITLHDITDANISRITHIAIDDNNAEISSQFLASLSGDVTILDKNNFKGAEKLESIDWNYHDSGIGGPDPGTPPVDINCDFPNLKYACATFCASYFPFNIRKFIGDLSNYTGLFKSSYLSHSTSRPYEVLASTEPNRLFHGQTEMVSFSGNLEKLIIGNRMFDGCQALTYFYSNLASLENGYLMFDNAALDSQSLIYIAATINDVSRIDTYTIDLPNNKSLFAEGFKSITIGTSVADGSDIFENINQELTIKDWEVLWQFNNVTSAYSLKEPSENSIIFVKKYQVNNGKYKDINSEERFDLIWAHKITNPKNIDDWKIFSSIEEAMQYHQLERFEEIVEN